MLPQNLVLAVMRDGVEAEVELLAGGRTGPDQGGGEGRVRVEKAGEDVANPGPAFTTRSGAGSGPAATVISRQATVACATAEPTLTSYVTGRRRGGLRPWPATRRAGYARSGIVHR